MCAVTHHLGLRHEVRDGLGEDNELSQVLVRRVIVHPLSAGGEGREFSVKVTRCNANIYGSEDGGGGGGGSCSNDSANNYYQQQ